MNRISDIEYYLIIAQHDQIHLFPIITDPQMECFNMNVFTCLVVLYLVRK
jgi:hypothetical protein